MRLLIPIFLVVSLSLQAQCTYNTLLDYENTVDGVGSNYVFDNNEVLASFFQVFPSPKFYMVRLDCSGDTLWSKTYVEEGHTNYFRPNKKSIMRINDDIYSIGRRRTAGAEDTTLGMLSKFDLNGNLIWKKHYGNSSLTQFMSFDHFQNHFYVGGNINETTGGVSDFNFRKIDLDGNELWSYTYGDDGDEILSSSAITYDDAFLMAGFEDTGFQTSQQYIVKADLDGGIIWEETFGSNKENWSFILPLQNGDFYLATSHQESIVGVGEPYQSDLYRFDANGDVLWEKNYSYINGFASNFIFFTEPILKENNLYIAGSIDNVNSYREGFLMKVTNDGDSLWLRRYSGNPQLHSYVYGLNSSPDGGFIISGTAFSYDVPISQDAWIVKVDSLGCLVPGCAVGIEEFKRENGYFKIGPIPTSDVLNVFIGEFIQNENGQITIRDALGKTVLSRNNTNSNITYMLNVSHLSSGVYTLSLEQKGVVLQTEKFLKH